MFGGCLRGSDLSLKASHVPCRRQKPIRWRQRCQRNWNLILCIWHSPCNWKYVSKKAPTELWQEKQSWGYQALWILPCQSKAAAAPSWGAARWELNLNMGEHPHHAGGWRAHTAWSNSASSHGNSVVSAPTHTMDRSDLPWPEQSLGWLDSVPQSLVQVTAWSGFFSSPSTSVSQPPGQLVLYRSAHYLGKAPRPWEGTDSMACSAPAPLSDFRVPQGRTLQPQLPTVFWGRGVTIQYLLIYFSANSG